MLIGLLLLALGLLMPLFLTVNNMGVYRAMNAALALDEKIYVISAAFRLLLLNIVRGYPYYLGAFFVGDALSALVNKRYKQWFVIISVFPMVLGEYLLIRLLYGISYSFGAPALLTLSMLLLLLRVDLTLVSNVKKCFTILFLHCAVQCLDVLPTLNGTFFGQGETSRDILTVSRFLGADAFLNTAVAFVFFLMALSTVLYAVLVADENHMKQVSIQKEQREHELMETRMREMEGRTYQELYHVAHDLKTPLTAIQTMTGILEIGEQDEKKSKYLSAIETSVEHMSRMITELLNERHFTLTAASEVVAEVMAQISVTPYASMVEASLPEEELYFNANHIRFGRMLINLLENAYYASDRETGRIRLCVSRQTAEGERYLRFDIEDNGRGMSKEVVKSIFERGFSTRGSSGLGLNFVKEVAAAHQGWVSVKSIPQEGTTFSVWVPEEEKDE